MIIKNKNEFNGNTYHYQVNVEIHNYFNTPQVQETVPKKISKPTIIPWFIEQIPKVWPYLKKLLKIAFVWLGIDSS